MAKPDKRKKTIVEREALDFEQFINDKQSEDRKFTTLEKRYLRSCMSIVYCQGAIAALEDLKHA